LSNPEEIAEKAIASLRGEKPAPQEPLLHAVLEGVGEWAGRFDKVITAIADGERDAGAELMRFVKDFRQIEADLGAVPRLRPQVQLVRNVETVVGHLRKGLEGYLEAFLVSEEEKAERLVLAGNEAFNQAAASIDSLERQSQLIEGISAAPLTDPSAWPFLAQYPLQGTRASDMLGYAREGQALVEDILGVRVPEEFGIGLRLTKLQVEALGLDPERFWRVLKRIHEMIEAHQPRISALTKNEQWLENFRYASVDLHLAGLRFATVSGDARSDLQVKALIGFGANLVEPISKWILQGIYVAYKGDSYSKVRRKDVNVLLHELRQVGFGFALYGLDMAIRDADAHQYGYNRARDTVHFQSNRAEYPAKSREELIDRVLGGLESVLAIHGALVLSLAKTGIDIEALDPIPVIWDMEIESRLEVLLSATGWRKIELDLSDDEPVIRGDFAFPMNTMSVVGQMIVGLIPYVPEDWQRIRLEVRDNSEQHIVSGEIGPIRRWQAETDEHRKLLAWVEFVGRWTMDGKALMPSSTIRAFMGALVFQMLRGNSEYPIAEFEELIAVANRLGDWRLKDTLARARRALILKSRGTAVRRQNQQALISLLKWAEDYVQKAR